jgi:hypothetical protein
MLITGQFRINSNINRITGRAPFDLVLRFRPKIRMNIEVATTENSHNILKKGTRSAARDKIKRKKMRILCETCKIYRK